MAVAAGVTAFLGLAGAGLAFAAGGGGTPAASLSASSSSSSTTPTSTPAGRLHPRMGKGGGPMLGFGIGAGRILHGQYTIDQNGTYKTIAVQNGQVVGAVSSSSLSVKSADGVTQTYSVQPSTVVDSQAGGIGTVHSGDTVTVQALVHSGSFTATNIVDVSQVGSSRKGFGLVPPGAPPGNGGSEGSAPSNPQT